MNTLIMKIKSVIAAIAIFSFISLPFNFVLAQEEEVEPVVEQPQDTSVEEDTVIEIENIPDEEIIETASPQESESGQETVPSEVLEEVINPQEPVMEEENTEEVLEEEIQEELIDEENVVEEIQEEVEEVAEISEEELQPKKEYTFELEGNSIASKENTEWSVEAGEVQEESSANITETPDIDVSDVGALKVSGPCTDPYFVVLIYRNEGDYDQNPSSYIYNKAFPCFNGEYSYSISELPFNLQSGRFYLLVAGQGATGSWKPITALIPVGITVKTVFPEDNNEIIEDNSEQDGN